MISYYGKNLQTVNYLKTVYFDRPAWIPAEVSIMNAAWMKYREDLEEIVLSHPRLFRGYRKGSRDFDSLPGDQRPGRLTDCWSCVWENVEAGLVGMVVGHPLEDWSALDTWKPANPETDNQWEPRDWELHAREMEEARRRGDLASGDLFHGFMYMYLYYLRGFENFMMDLATDEPRVRELIAVVERYNTRVIERFVELGAEQIGVGDDLGLQRSLPMSPRMWRTFIKPSYDRLFRRPRERGLVIGQHTDGHILEIIPDLIEVGVKVLNPQIRANGLEGLRQAAKGKVALKQDLDRQLFPFATPSQIDDHIGEVCEGLYDPRGGLMLVAEIEQDVPLENIEAICRSMERVCKLPEEP